MVIVGFIWDRVCAPFPVPGRRYAWALMDILQGVLLAESTSPAPTWTPQVVMVCVSDRDGVKGSTKGSLWGRGVFFLSPLAESWRPHGAGVP